MPCSCVHTFDARNRSLVDGIGFFKIKIKFEKLFSKILYWNCQQSFSSMSFYLLNSNIDFRLYLLQCPYLNRISAMYSKAKIKCPIYCFVDTGYTILHLVAVNNPICRNLLHVLIAQRLGTQYTLYIQQVLIMFVICYSAKFIRAHKKSSHPYLHRRDANLSVTMILALCMRQKGKKVVQIKRNRCIVMPLNI